MTIINNIQALPKKLVEWLDSMRFYTRVLFTNLRAIEWDQHHDRMEEFREMVSRDGDKAVFDLRKFGSSKIIIQTPRHSTYIIEPHEQGTKYDVIKISENNVKSGRKNVDVSITSWKEKGDTTYKLQITPLERSPIVTDIDYINRMDYQKEENKKEEQEK